MTDSFYLGAYWGDRRCTAEECGKRAALCLRQLACNDEVFGHWYKKGRSRSDALRSEVAADTAELTDLFLAGVNRTDIGGSVVERLGFRAAIWNGAPPQEAVSIAFTCGCHAGNPGLVNSCVLDLPEDGPAAERVLCKQALISLMSAVVSSWDPDWAAVLSRRYREQLGAHTRGPIVGWLFYMSHRLGVPPALPSPAQLVPLADHGSLIVVSPGRFSVDDSDHLQAIELVNQALAEAGLLTPQ